MISNKVHRFPLDRQDPNLEVCVKVKKSIKIWVEYKEAPDSLSFADKKVNETFLHLQNVIRDEVIRQRQFRGETLWVQSPNRNGVELRTSLFGKIPRSSEQIEEEEREAVQAKPLEMIGQSQKHIKRLKTEKSGDFLLTFDSIKKILEDLYAKGNLKERSNQIKATQLENTDKSLAQRSSMPERTFDDVLTQSPKKSNFLLRGLSKIWSVVTALFKGLGHFFQKLFFKKSQPPQPNPANPAQEDGAVDSLSYCSNTMIINDLKESDDESDSLENDSDTNYQTDTFRNNELNDENYQTDTFRNNELK